MNISELMNMMNYNLSRHSGKSMLGEIEKKIVDLYFSNPHLDTQKMDSFEANLYSDSRIFDQNIDYSSVNTVNNYYNNKKIEYINSKTINSKQL